MSKKVNNLVLMSLHAALEAVDLNQFMQLFKEAVEDTGALENDCSGLTKQRRQQFEKGIAKILKARKGALKDEELFSDDCDCNSDTCEVCHMRDQGERLPKNKRQKKGKDHHEDIGAANGVTQFSRATVSRLLALKTGLLFTQVGVKKDAMVNYSEEDVNSMLRNVDYLSDLRTGLYEMFGCNFKITGQGGMKLAHETPLNRHNPRYIVTLESV